MNENKPRYYAGVVVCASNKLTSRKVKVLSNPQTFLVNAKDNMISASEVEKKAC